MYRRALTPGSFLGSLVLVWTLGCGTSSLPSEIDVDGGAESDARVVTADANVAETSAPRDSATNPGPDGASDGSPSSTDAGTYDGVDADPSRGAPFNFAPPTRTVAPVAVFSTTGAVADPTNVLKGKPTSLAGAGAAIVLDFGKEVGGYTTLTFSAADANQTIGLAFSESSLYVGQNSDNSNGGGGSDGALSAPVSGPTTYTVAAPNLRGGFRYLTVFLSSSGSVSLSNVSLAFSPDPNRAIPNQYPNYFYSNDDTLNKAWYAGAYTFQTNLVRGTEGRAWPAPASGWNNGATIGPESVYLCDGAKRDRTVWPGDMGISLPTGYASLFDTISAKNSLDSIYKLQAADGSLPFAGPPVDAPGSDTYHMWSLVGTYLAFLYSGDKTWLDSVWPQYKLAVAYIANKIDGTGLVNVTQAQDWARDDQGGDNVEANAIFYGVLSGATALANAEGDSTDAASYASLATALKTQINATLWDTTRGAYKDNPTSTLYPQDGNALAAWFGVVDDATKAKSISYVLNENWNAIGSRGPEFTRGTGAPLISTFAGSMELMSHFAAGYDARGLDMIRNMWGFMLTSPNGTASTIWEGFTSDGSFAYPAGPVPAASYTSLAHGWGTGPTSALTFFTLGVAPDTAAGATYHVIPHPGDLTHAEGNLMMAAGESVSVAYDVGADCKTFAMSVDSRALGLSVGTIGVPTFGATHTILVDGVAAWNGTSFTGAVGIGGARSDASYVYFTSVQPGARTFRFTDGTACPPTPEQWTFCADENATCTFSGTKRVRFGKNGKYDYAIVSGSSGPVACNVATMGPDPIPNTLKSCALSDDLYTFCANEGDTCTVSGTKQVRFGANGQWATLPVTGSVVCSAAAFTDPLPNVVKTCEYE